jgi:uncharacterized beta-barrel protein YwiB (DUF1934 family)
MSKHSPSSPTPYGTLSKTYKTSSGKDKQSVASREESAFPLDLGAVLIHYQLMQEDQHKQLAHVNLS